MLGTLISVIIAIYLAFNPMPVQISHPLLIAIPLFVISCLIVLVQTLLTGFAWGPLQKNEQNFASHTVEMFRKDRHFRYTNALLLIFLLLTLFVSIELVFVQHYDKLYLVVSWIVALGLAIDLMHHFVTRIHEYLDPFYVVDLFQEEATRSIQYDQERELCYWIEALSETGIKAIEKNSPSLTNRVLEQLQHVMRTFLTSSKSFVHKELDDESKEMGITDRVSYTLFYFFEHLEYLHACALNKNLETVSSRCINILGKIVFFAASYDMTYASYPIHFIGKFAKEAQSRHFSEIGEKASLTLLQVSKQIISDIDIKYANLQDPFLSIVTHMNEIAKETFRQDKSTDINLLKQPFLELKEILGAIKDHQDAPIIEKSIDNVLDEFATLETVLSTLPPLPGAEEEEEEEEKPQE